MVSAGIVLAQVWREGKQTITALAGASTVNSIPSKLRRQNQLVSSQTPERLAGWMLAKKEVEIKDGQEVSRCTQNCCIFTTQPIKQVEIVGA